MAGTWDRALSAGRPVVPEAPTDPNVAPLPPHIKFSRAMAFAQVLIGGDPEASGVVKQWARETLAGFFHR